MPRKTWPIYAYVDAQFSHCRLSWMLHERYLQKTYSDNISALNELHEIDNCLFIKGMNKALR